MTGTWTYRPKAGNWCFMVDGRVDITITDARVTEISERHAISKAVALEWIQTRPKEPYRTAA